MAKDEIKIEDDLLDDELFSVPDFTMPEFRWTVKRQEFVYHVARHGNGYQAARDAGMADKSSEWLLKQQAVRDAVQEEIANQLAASKESEESVIARWAMWAKADVCSIFNADWTLKSMEKIPDAQRKCIKKIKVTHSAHGRNIEVEMFDAHKANNDLAQMMGLLGKGDNDTTPPEETAKQLQSALQEMRILDGDSVPVETPSGSGSEETGRRLN